MRAKGLRLTSQRRILADLLEQAEEHLDAEAVYRLARRKDPRIHRATVYRTLNTLKKLGLVDELRTSDDYLLAASDSADIYEVTYTAKQTVMEKLSSMFAARLGRDRMIPANSSENTYLV